MSDIQSGSGDWSESDDKFIAKKKKTQIQIVFQIIILCKLCCLVAVSPFPIKEKSCLKSLGLSLERLIYI